jgi:polyferredoxin
MNLGDCIDCNACVNVCPVGIDIRDGQQLECITCALCIDACDDIMDKVGKPRGLIDYMALTDEAQRARGQAQGRSGSTSSACARSSTQCSGPPSASA